MSSSSEPNARTHGQVSVRELETGLAAQPSSTPLQQDRDEVAGKLQAGYSLCHPENDCEGLRAWARISGMVEEAATYLDGLGKETIEEAEGGGGLDPESVEAKQLAGKAEGYFDAAEYLRTEFARPPQQDPPLLIDSQDLEEARKDPKVKELLDRADRYGASLRGEPEIESDDV